MPAPAWLTARQIAHRGLHGAMTGAVENSMGAAECAIAGGYAIECDVQLSADGVPMVFHDEELDRLTFEKGLVQDRQAAELETLPLRGGGGTIPRLSRFLALIDGRVPLIVEMKSTFDGNTALAEAVMAVLAPYRGPVAVMSFDPELVKAAKRIDRTLPRGLVACRFEAGDWPMLSAGQRLSWRFLLSAFSARPDFIAYDQKALPALAPLALRWVLGKPLLSWTVRDEKTARRLRPFVDQIIFEGFTPAA